MLIAGIVILTNICARSIQNLTVDQTQVNGAQQELKGNFHKDLIISSTDLLLDIEENKVEVEEKEEESSSKGFYLSSPFVFSGAFIFSWSNDKIWINSFFATCQDLSLFLLFENFRL